MEIQMWDLSGNMFHLVSDTMLCIKNIGYAAVFELSFVLHRTLFRSRFSNKKHIDNNTYAQSEGHHHDSFKLRSGRYSLNHSWKSQPSKKNNIYGNISNWYNF